jgi:hypothetical protein
MGCLVSFFIRYSNLTGNSLTVSRCHNGSVFAHVP